MAGVRPSGAQPSPGGQWAMAPSEAEATKQEEGSGAERLLSDRNSSRPQDTLFANATTNATANATTNALGQLGLRGQRQVNVNVAGGAARVAPTLLPKTRTSQEFRKYLEGFADKQGGSPMSDYCGGVARLMAARLMGLAPKSLTFRKLVARHDRLFRRQDRHLMRLGAKHGVAITRGELKKGHIPSAKIAKLRGRLEGRALKGLDKLLSYRKRLKAEHTTLHAMRSRSTIARYNTRTLPALAKRHRGVDPSMRFERIEHQQMVATLRAGKPVVVSVHFANADGSVGKGRANSHYLTLIKDPHSDKVFILDPLPWFPKVGAIAIKRLLSKDPKQALFPGYSPTRLGTVFGRYTSSPSAMNKPPAATKS
jgi:hypothetical protein